MKFDITKLPVLEATIGFLLLVLAITFVFAFQWVNGENDDDSAVSETTAPTNGGTPGTDFTVSLRDNSFDPAQMTVVAGEDITFNITNDGGAAHNMRIAGADNEYDNDDDAVSDPDFLGGGDEAVVTWTAPSEPGDIDFRCDFHPTDMTGTITVQ